MKRNVIQYTFTNSNIKKALFPDQHESTTIDTFFLEVRIKVRR